MPVRPTGQQGTVHRLQAQGHQALLRPHPIPRAPVPAPSHRAPAHRLRLHPATALRRPRLPASHHPRARPVLLHLLQAPEVLHQAAEVLRQALAVPARRLHLRAV